MKSQLKEISTTTTTTTTRSTTKTTTTTPSKESQLKENNKQFRRYKSTLTADIRIEWHRMHQPESTFCIGHQNAFGVTFMHIGRSNRWLIIVCDQQTVLNIIRAFIIGLGQRLTRHTLCFVEREFGQSPLVGG